MHKTMEEVTKICEMRNPIEAYMCGIINGNCDAMNYEQAGAFIDMIKDLYESEKNAWKACYYRKMVEGMEPPAEEERDRYMRGPMGYDNWRYSSGRFAPTGKGHRSGYMMDDEIYERDNLDKYGYTGPDRMWDRDRSAQDSDRDRYGYPRMMDQDMRHGDAYRKWTVARKHYTESKSQHDKDEMNMHTKEHMKDAAVSIKEMYLNADPELKKEIKKDLTALIGEMPT